MISYLQVLWCSAFGKVPAVTSVLDPTHRQEPICYGSEVAIAFEGIAFVEYLQLALDLFSQVWIELFDIVVPGGDGKHRVIRDQFHLVQVIPDVQHFKLFQLDDDGDGQLREPVVRQPEVGQIWKHSKLTSFHDELILQLVARNVERLKGAEIAQDTWHTTIKASWT